MQDENNMLAELLWGAVHWIHVTLVIIGVVAVVGFARLNFGGEELEINFDVTESAKKK